jgi:hypothetical protein
MGLDVPERWGLWLCVTVRPQTDDVGVPPAGRRPAGSDPAESSSTCDARPSTLGWYAGKQVLTAAGARAYADDHIAVHLSEEPYHGGYSLISTAALAQPDNAQLKALETTSFQGANLRGLLVEAYGFSQFGAIVLIASVVSFVGAGLFWFSRRSACGTCGGSTPPRRSVPGPCTSATRRCRRASDSCG